MHKLILRLFTVFGVLILPSCLFTPVDKTFILKNETSAEITLTKIEKVMDFQAGSVLSVGSSVSYTALEGVEAHGVELTFKGVDYRGGSGYIDDYVKYTLTFYEKEGELAGKINATFFGKPESYPSYIERIDN